MIYIVLAGGLYLILIGTWLETSNFQSMLIFKFVPIILGMMTVFYAGMTLGWLIPS